MKRITFLLLATFLLHLPFSLKASNNIVQKRAVMIIAHGAPYPHWGTEVLKLDKQVTNLLKENHIDNIDCVKIALMEFNKPTIADVVKQMEKRGVTDLLAIPLFIAPSDHSGEDIPNILGCVYNKKKCDELTAEGIELVDTRIKIHIAPTLSYGDLIEKVILDRVKTLQKKGTRENLVLLAHGSRQYEPIWKDFIERVGKYVIKNTTIKKFDYGFVEIGQTFKEDGVSVVRASQKNCDHVIVQGVYLSSGIKSIARMAGAASILKEEDITFGPYGLLPDARVGQWISDRIIEWVKR